MTAKATPKLYGKISAKLMGLEGEVDVSLLDASEDSPQTVSCNDGAELPINRTEFITLRRALATMPVNSADLKSLPPMCLNMILRQWIMTEPSHSPAKFQTFPPAPHSLTFPSRSFRLKLSCANGAPISPASRSRNATCPGEYAPKLQIRVSFQQIQ